MRDTIVPAALQDIELALALLDRVSRFLAIGEEATGILSARSRRRAGAWPGRAELARWGTGRFAPNERPSYTVTARIEPCETRYRRKFSGEISEGIDSHGQ